MLKETLFKLVSLTKSVLVMYNEEGGDLNDRR